MQRRLAIILVLLTSAAALAEGDAIVVVHFVDGRSLEVERFERNGEAAILHMSGGGSLAVPADRITNWTELTRRPAQPPLSEISISDAWRGVAGEYADVLAQAADRHRLDPVLLTAVAQVESSLDPTAISPKGAQGLLQLMPATAARFGVDDAFDVQQNVEAGARYLSWLLERYDGETELALAGYNAGEAAVDRYDGVPPYPETQAYVARVLERVGRLGSPAP
jgi:soluble lytic murein transglycosylase-like protein